MVHVCDATAPHDIWASRQVYREFDLDGNGEVGADEMLELGQARRRLGQKSGKWTQEMNQNMLNRMGADRHRNVTMESFVSYFEEKLGTDEAWFKMEIAQFMQCAQEQRQRKKAKAREQEQDAQQEREHNEHKEKKAAKCRERVEALQEVGCLPCLLSYASPSRPTLVMQEAPSCQWALWKCTSWGPAPAALPAHKAQRHAHGSGMHMAQECTWLRNTHGSGIHMGQRHAHGSGMHLPHTQSTCRMILGTRYVSTLIWQHRMYGLILATSSTRNDCLNTSVDSRKLSLGFK